MVAPGDGIARDAQPRDFGFDARLGMKWWATSTQLRRQHRATDRDARDGQAEYLEAHPSMLAARVLRPHPNSSVRSERLALHQSDASRNPRLLTFAELVAEQFGESLQRRSFVRATDLDLNLAADAGGQHHHAHDAFPIDAPIVAAQRDFTLEAARQFRKLGGRPRMQSELIADSDGRFDLSAGLAA
jgi:hypothetical protein